MIEPRYVKVYGQTIVRVFDTWTEVILPDGKVVLGTPSADQAPIAADLGYTDLDQMCQEHDPFHAALCDVLGVRVSYALREAAGDKLTPDEQGAAVLEETAVLAALKFRQHHRWLLGRVRDPGLNPHSSGAVHG
jgi:hypothetical protein